MWRVRGYKDAQERYVCTDNCATDSSGQPEPVSYPSYHFRRCPFPSPNFRFPRAIVINQGNSPSYPEQSSTRIVLFVGVARASLDLVSSLFRNSSSLQNTSRYSIFRIHGRRRSSRSAKFLRFVLTNLYISFLHEKLMPFAFTRV